jgi:hypothetical protein
MKKATLQLLLVAQGIVILAIGVSWYLQARAHEKQILIRSDLGLIYYADPGFRMHIQRSNNDERLRMKGKIGVPLLISGFITVSLAGMTLLLDTRTGNSSSPP